MRGDQAGAGVATRSPSDVNRAQRFAVLNQAVEMTQQVFAGAFPANGVLNIPPRNVGLLKKFIIQIDGTANETGTATPFLTDFGLGNVLSQISFTDLNNNVRAQTSGWHLNLLHKARFRFGQAATFLAGAMTQQELSGDNDAVINNVPPAKSGSHAFRAIFELPIAYSDDDLRGAIYMNVVNAVANLQLTLNPNPFSAAADSTLAVFKTGAGNFSGVTATVYQVYLDQLPVGKGGVPVLPVLDLSTIYELKNTAFTGFVVNQDFPIPYANFRDFLSTWLIYNHDPSADTGRTGNADISYFALQSANFTNIFKYPPVISALKARQLMLSDPPPGGYYFSNRRKPLSTTTYGNMELILNPLIAAAGAYALVGWEDFALVNALQNAGSLAG